MMVADTALMNPGSTTVMEKQSNNQQAAPLKCPRCDSSNTKFCYYNNYSLSQPRHFCKACKRYWTRGGTLRSVPVGGGCRKNKRVKKPMASSAASATPTLAPPPPPPPPPQLSLPITSQIDVRPADLNPLFYPLPSDMGELNFPALRHRLDPPFSYDLQPHFNGLGVGFSPNHQYSADEYRSGFGQNLSHLQQSVSTTTSLLHDYQLIGTSWSQPKKANDYQALLPFEDLLASVNGNLGMMKQVKVEGEYDGIDWQLPCENPLESMTTAADVTGATAGPGDSSFLYWNLKMGATGWPDTNYESSVAPLI